MNFFNHTASAHSFKENEPLTLDKTFINLSLFLLSTSKTPPLEWNTLAKGFNISE